MVRDSTNSLSSDLNHILYHTADLFEELRGRRIFITGGTGFFGSWILESFAWANDRLGLGAEAVVLTRNPEFFARKAGHLASHSSIRFHAGDVRSFSYPDGEFSHIIHAATPASAALNEQDPLLMLDTIVEGTRRTLDFAVDCRAGKYLFTSSGAVYGRQPSGITHLPEEYNGTPSLNDPSSAYGQGKRVAEYLCTLYSERHELEAKIARCFAFVGPYLPLDIHFAVGNFIRDGMAGGPIHVRGDGTPYRSYLYAADLVIWLWTVLIRGETCRPYNMGSEQAVTIAELAEIVAGCFDPAVDVLIEGKLVKGKDTERYVPSTQRIQKELKVKESVAIRDAVRRTISWYRDRAAVSSGDRLSGP